MPKKFLCLTSVRKNLWNSTTKAQAKWTSFATFSKAVSMLLPTWIKVREKSLGCGISWNKIYWIFPWISNFFSKFHGFLGAYLKKKGFWKISIFSMDNYLWTKLLVKFLCFILKKIVASNPYFINSSTNVKNL